MTHALMDVATPSDGEMSFDYGDMAKEAMEDLEEQAGRITDLKRQVQRLAAKHPESVCKRSSIHCFRCSDHSPQKNAHRT